MSATQYDLLHLVLVDFLKDLADFVLVALCALILPTIEGTWPNSLQKSATLRIFLRKSMRIPAKTTKNQITLIQGRGTVAQCFGAAPGNWTIKESISGVV